MMEQTLRYLYFPGCKIASHLPQYDLATRSVLGAFDISLDSAELNCCGYPARDLDFTAAVFSSARILAVAAKKELPILCPCKCCFGSLKHADYWLRHQPGLRHRIAAMLREEDLSWEPGVPVRHLLSVLVEDVGLDRVREKIRKPYTGLPVAVHYGCHALRPAEVTRFDDPLAPTIFEKLVQTTGADPVDWPLRLDCCGYPLWGKNDRLSLKLMEKKLSSAHMAGARVLITACTYCQLQFDTVRSGQETLPILFPELPAVLVTQFLGVAMGQSAGALGLERNHIAWTASPA
jgi:heterodisulfide reductase subunit B